MRWYFKGILEKINRGNDKGNKTKNNYNVYPRALLNFMTFLDLTNFAGTISGFFPIVPFIKQASQANPKCGFEKEENKTDQANQPCDGAIRIDKYNQYKHY